MNAASPRVARAGQPTPTPAALEATPWAQAFLIDAPTSYKQAIEFAQQPGLRVFIRPTDENGYRQWAICVEEKPDFWMDAFDTRTQAVALCKTMTWKMVAP